MILPNGNCWLYGQRFGIETSVRSAKLLSNIHIRATQPFCMQSNQNWYSCNGKDRVFFFAGMEKLIRKNFLPHLFFGKTKTLSPIIEKLNPMPVKKSWLGLQNTLTPAHRKFESSQHASAELVNAVTGNINFSTTYHIREAREEWSEEKKTRDKANKIKLEETVQDRPKIKCRIMLCAKNTGF